MKVVKIVAFSPTAASSCTSKGFWCSLHDPDFNTGHPNLFLTTLHTIIDVLLASVPISTILRESYVAKYQGYPMFDGQTGNDKHR